MAAKSAKRPVAKKQVTYAPLPNVIVLTKQAALLLWNNKWLLGGIALIYVVLSLVFVQGVGGNLGVAELRNQFSSQVVGTLAAYAQLIGNSTGSSNPAGSVYQSVLFVIVSLAIIWALRQVVAGEKATIRNAFYRGMYPLVPFMLVLLVIGLQLLPMLIGASLYQLVVVSGIASTTIEVALWGLVALALALLSLYLLVSSIVALYIVTLPNMTPLQALRAARELLRRRRWTVLRKMLFLPLALLVVAGIVMVPFILLLPLAAGWVLFALGIVAIVAAHGYIYNLYRELLNEQ